jgi:hypothetical protein
MGTEMVKFLQFELCFSIRGVAMPKERRTARMARNWHFIVIVSTLVVQWGSDWMVVTERGVIKRGVIKRGVIKRGVIKRGVIKRGVIKRGVIKRGVIKRGKYCEKGREENFSCVTA